MFIDGLVISKLDGAMLSDMQRGGLTAANCTCSVWEDFQGTMKNIAEIKRLISNNKDKAIQIYSTDDIDRAKREGKVGIILGWQNSSGIDTNLDYVALFAELGLRIVQLTYNTANYAGCGCYETVDRGLTDFGRDLVDELAANRILVDLSHVGPVTSRDVVDHTSGPFAITHCCPSALKQHPRNKSDEEIRHVIDKGGFVGVAGVPHFLPSGIESSVDDFARAIAHIVNVAGEDHVGIGTDITQGYGPDFYEWIALDKGNGRRLTSFADAPILRGFESLDQYPNIVAALERAGMNSRVVEKVMGVNWYNFLRSSWN